MLSIGYSATILLLYLIIDVYNTFNTQKSNIANKYVLSKIKIKQIIMIFNFSYFNIILFSGTFIIQGFIFAILLIKFVQIYTIINTLGFNKLAVININNYLALLYILLSSQCIYTCFIAYVMLIFLDPIKIDY
jgi:hypothetical protein